MLKYPQIDPIALSIGPFEVAGHALGPLQVHWYGLMYLIGFAGAWLLAMHRATRPDSVVKREQIEDLIVYGALGVILGGRLGYAFFYHFDRVLQEPLWLFKVWEGGMSFHGGILGVICAMWFYSRRIGCSLLALTDFVAPLAPLGLGCGRIGNFIGQELWGRATDVSWAMVFPRDHLALPRHPSQLYQAALEGLVLFVIIYWFSSRPRARGLISGLFLIFYGSFRFVVEFFREPDSHIGFDVLGWMTRGQLLSLPMMLAGLAILGWALLQARAANKHTAAESAAKEG